MEQIISAVGAQTQCVQDKPAVPRQEYPRPQFVRQEYRILNGTWQFSFDDKGIGLREKWYDPSRALEGRITVPYAPECKCSGVDDPGPHAAMFYKREFTLPDEWRKKRLLLHFGAVDYRCRVYVNGEMAGCHEGGSVGFSFDITDLLLPEVQQNLCVYVEDPWRDQTIPRGKQFWETESKGIWYTRTSGIWQTVWLEPVAPAHIESVRFTPDVDTGSVQVEIIAPEAVGHTAQIQICYQGETVAETALTLTWSRTSTCLFLLDADIFRSNAHGDGWLWWPWAPHLFTVHIRLLDGSQVTDMVNSYFGMRKIHTKNGLVYLNNRPFYMKLVLDQGYWPDGLLTAPDDEAFRTDIQMAKKLGFNGCRKHQKVEDPRFLYWADHLGFLVWGEIAAPCLFNDEAATALTQEWMEVVERDYNHPSIVCWVPINESWGVSQINLNQQQQEYSLSLYHLLKALDGTRLVVNNDGWEMTYSDLCAVHNYAHGEAEDSPKFSYFRFLLSDREAFLQGMPAGRPVYADGFSYQGEPILLTECGGIAYQTTTQENGWGYTSAASEEDFIRDYKRVIDAILASPFVYGFCYTQLTDVEQEINGLLTYDRRFKCTPEEICTINSRWRNNVLHPSL